MPTWSPTAHATVDDNDTSSLSSSSGFGPTLTFAIVSIIAPVSEILRMRTAVL